MKNKIINTLLIVIAVSALLGSGFLLGFKFGKKFPEILLVRGVQNVEVDSSNNVDFGVFWQTWQLINDNYLRAKNITNQDKLRGAIKGLVGSLGDPYSEYFPPEDNKKFREDIQGNFGGIGAELGVRKNQLVIIAPLKNTPASSVGLLAGDFILMINSSSTEGMTVDQAVNLIRGPEGTEVVITILREGWNKTKDFKIIRANIEVPTLDVQVKEGDIAYVQLHSFNANANMLFYREMAKIFASGGTKGMILDLRNDPGGYLEVAVDLAGWFLPRGSLVVSETGKTGNGEVFKANGNGALKDLPLVVLINKGSASAAEILAGTLRDGRKIKLIGETSFGKGTVQQLLPLRDGSSVKLTMAHWVLPNGGILENGGLSPDIEVKMTEDDVNQKRDPQFDKAMEVLKSEIAKINK